MCLGTGYSANFPGPLGLSATCLVSYLQMMASSVSVSVTFGRQLPFPSCCTGWALHYRLNRGGDFLCAPNAHMVGKNC